MRRRKAKFPTVYPPNENFEYSTLYPKWFSIFNAFLLFDRAPQISQMPFLVHAQRTSESDELSIIFEQVVSSIGPTLALLTSLPIQDGGPHDFRSKMAAPTTPRWRPPRNQDGGPCDAFGYTLEGESTP